jgi:hypothetical protein
MDNHKMSKGDYEASLIGDIIIGILKIPYYILKLGYNYVKYSVIGIQKVVLSKLKTIRSKLILSGLIVTMVSTIVTYFMIRTNHTYWNWGTLGSFLVGIIYLPYIDKFMGEPEPEYNLNDDFIGYYEKMGFKNDIEKDLEYPYCIGLKEDKKGNTIYSFKLNYNKVSAFEKAIDVMESIVNLNVIDIRKNEINKSIVEVVFSENEVKPERLNIFIEMKKPIKNYDCIPLDSETDWNYRDCPHGLICGITKGGKSSMLFYFIRQILARKATLRIVDPKKSALSYLENYVGKNCASETEDIVKLVKQFVDDMDNRFRDMKKHPEYRAMTDYADYGFKPYFLIFDEVMSFMGGSANSEDKKMVNDCLLDIIAKGREAGFFTVLTTQRADTKYINGSLRDQLGLRMSLGSLSSDGYKMTFGRTDFDLKDMTKGAGFIYLDGTGMDKAREFTSPFIPKSYNFFEDFKSLLGEIEIKKVENEDQKEIQEKEVKTKKDSNVVSLRDIKKVKLAKEK